METTQLKNIVLSAELMDANQISVYTKETYQYKEYTAFEVFPTLTDIEAGTESDVASPFTKWKTATAYAIGDIVEDANGNNIYQAIKAMTITSNIQPGVTEGWETYWKKIMLTAPNWLANFTYDIGSLAMVNGNTYEATASNTNVQPEVTTDWNKKWKLFTRTYSSPVKNGKLIYARNIPACMTLKFIVRSDGKAAWNDFKIDLGDGTIISSIEDSKVSISGDEATITHTYTTQGKYIVKIYGNIFGLYNVDNTGNYNLISRIWDGDLPISSSCYSWKSVLRGNRRLLKVDIPYTFKWPKGNLGLYYTFYQCQNLIYFKSNTTTPFTQSMQCTFYNCFNLVDCMMEYEGYGVWKSVDTRYAQMFVNCSSLVTVLYKLLPWRGWMTQYVSIADMFMNCKSLPPVIFNGPEAQKSTINIERILWNLENHGFIFDKSTNESKGFLVFVGCSDELRALIPTTWGGTKS